MNRPNRRGISLNRLQWQYVIASTTTWIRSSYGGIDHSATGSGFLIRIANRNLPDTIGHARLA